MTIKTVSDMGEQYHLCQIHGEFEDLCGSVGLPRYNRQYTYGFAKLGDGEVLELWGYDGMVPFTYKTVELIYDSRIGSIFFELSHAFYAIGELHKTRRFPVNRDTFINRVYEWIQVNRPNVHPTDVMRFAVIAAFNFHWLKTSVMEWYGIERDSLWIER